MDNNQHNIYSNYQNYITNQNRPIMIQCSHSLFIGDLRDSFKIIYLHVRQEPTVILNRPVFYLLYFLLRRNIISELFHTCLAPTQLRLRPLYFSLVKTAIWNDPNLDTNPPSQTYNISFSSTVTLIEARES